MGRMDRHSSREDEGLGTGMWGFRDGDDPGLGRMQGWGRTPRVGSSCPRAAEPQNWDLQREGDSEEPLLQPLCSCLRADRGSSSQISWGCCGGLEAPVGPRARPEPGSGPEQEGGIPRCLPAPSHGPGSCVPPLSPRGRCSPRGHREGLEVPWAAPLPSRLSISY